MGKLTCVNPLCQEVVIWTPGQAEVICPKCGTWHLPKQDTFPQAENDPYSTPSSLGNAQHPTTTDLPVLPDYDPVPPDPNAPASGLDPQSKADPVQERTSPGYLTTPDGSKFRLKVGQNLIGRKNCDITLDNETVSRRHGVLEVTPLPNGSGWTYTLCDIGHLESTPSTNGVYLHGRSVRLQNHECITLADGATFHLGNASLMLHT